MKFASTLDAQLFVTEVGRLDLAEEVDSDFKPTKEMIDEFIKRRRELVGKLKDFRRSQDSKQSWRHNRRNIMHGIKKFHSSTDGKRFHRELGRFLATRFFGTNESLSTYEAGAALKALSSVRTHAYIELEYYHSLQEEIEYWHFLEEVLPAVSSAEAKILKQESFELTEQEAEVLLRLTDYNNLIASIAERMGRTWDVVNDLWKKAVGDTEREKNLIESDDGYYAEVLSRIERFSAVAKDGAVSYNQLEA